MSLKTRRLLPTVIAITFVILITIGVFAKNKWFPSTDGITGARSGWFGTTATESPDSWFYSFAPPTPTPQLSKEYIYAGTRLLAVEDANANAACPPSRFERDACRASRVGLCVREYSYPLC